jgi:hypothetical protein
MIPAQFNAFSSHLDNTGILNALLTHMRPLTEGKVSEFPMLAKKFPDLLKRLNVSTITELREQVTAELNSSLGIANESAKSSFALAVGEILAKIQSNNENAVVPAEMMERYYRPHSLKDHKTPDLLYRLLMIPGHQLPLAGIDNLIITILKALNENLVSFIMHASRVAVDSNLLVLAEVKTHLEEIVDNDPLVRCRAFSDSLGVVATGRNVHRMEVLFGQYKEYSKRTRGDHWYPKWFELISKLPTASQLFGKHDQTVTTLLNGVVHNVEMLNDVTLGDKPPFATELYVELMHVALETIGVVGGLVEMRSLFISDYHKISVALADA